MNLATIERMSTDPTGPVEVHIGPRPQNRPHAEFPGCYELVFSRPRTDVVPGEETRIDIYVTGYGSISGGKIHFMPPTGLIEPGACWVDHDLRLEDGKLSFGAAQSPQGEGGAILQFTNGVKHSGWPESTLFFDVGGVGIMTENSAVNPPVRVRLKIKKGAHTGDHDLSFAFTYFNGQEWRISYRTVVLHVPTLYERYEGRAWVIGATIAVMAMLASIIAAVAAILAIPQSGSSQSSNPTPTPSISKQIGATSERPARTPSSANLGTSCRVARGSPRAFRGLACGLALAVRPALSARAM